MKRARLPLLAVLPVAFISFVVAVPFVLGDHPLRWESGSAVPKFVRQGQDAETPAADESPEPTAAAPTGPATAQVPKVDAEWKPGMPQWGVQIYWEDNAASPEYLDKQARKQANYLVGLHANSVSLSFPFAVGGKTSEKVSPSNKTPSPERLARVLGIFHDAGLRTTVRPLLDEKASLDVKAGQWRGNIEPANRAAWFSSYQAFLAPYFKTAQDTKVTTFVVATELNSLEGDTHWKALVDAGAKDFSGEIAYDANWDSYVAKRISMPVDHLGIDAYFPVKVADDASVKTLVNGWNTWLNKKTAGSLPDITISEAGIGAMDGAYRAPGDFTTKRAVNTKVQATWYTAVCQVVQERKMSGVYWWSIYFDSDPNTAPDDNVASRLDFAGRPETEQAVKDCFTSGYAGPGTAATR
ncbi:hypothetical protein OU787_16755 [Kitasatospora sp. YST-16]|uniref:glycoside hydrolase family 113 n=1 Tax=Kitasatospora sp. YST-16 TaxID=2998080 RepID=UPI00228381F6|nr:hypothetical protein [Kitasatospora sp. YST-16]WAL73010.1 hypothetical protein OU787_16755 [Kitasatospora sp. YST-16]WNW39061.1 hypothetical protein RKE32_16710 [Streptomyces sp. Li-HN-5-13]